jgi:hypothetical protein
MKKNTTIFYLFIIAFVFQITMLKFIWNLETISRIINTFYLLTVLFIFIYAIFKEYKVKVWKYYLFPGVLIFSGLVINILISSLSDFTVLAQLGSAIPWLLVLVIPYFMDYKKVNFNYFWELSYQIIVTFVFLGLIDYYIIFINGNVSKYLETPYGDFIGGSFSILHMLLDGSPHFRFYSFFAEPGTLAMVLLPFIAYSILKKFYFGFLVLLTGFILSFSLGGYLSLLILLFLLFLHKSKKNNILVTSFFISIISLFTYFYVSNELVQMYENKGNSANIRENNFSNSITKIPSLIINYPFGIPLSNSTSEMEKDTNYTGSNFIPNNYLQSGGVLSFTGYLLFLIFSTKMSLKILFSKNKNYSIENVVVAISIISILPFLFQRTTIWESSIFAFLFAPVLLNVLTQKS